ncbi:glycoside hydrolase family 13 protein [Phytohabitans houttuyneae]|uniref:Alpha-glycosidase n=1 Tax=Phytohabitans houttuyneae TaxID=1076126 RepID=A0A6V8KQ23_9ACTN|nr:glycoside hydrolase family 13 protein [Phytohabitans houttuyneae]GFJ84481.1 alpha-glycosidase [Phytohabitans houttuyneae]
MPHHDGTMVSTQTPALGETVTVFVRVPAGTPARRVHVRSTPDGEPHFTPAAVDRTTPDATWWRAEVVVRNPVTNYRFLVDDRWLNGLGVAAHDVPDDLDFRLVAHDPPPAWSRDAVVYEIFPDRFARSGRDLPPAPDWAVPCDWDTPVDTGQALVQRQFYGGDLDGIAGRLDHLERLGVNTVYLTPIFPARSNHRYDAAAFDRIDPLLGGDAALARLAAAVHARGWRLIGDVTTNHTGDAHPWFTAAVSDVEASERAMYYFDESGDYESWTGVKTLPKLNWASPVLRERLAEVVRAWRRPPYGLDGWRVDVANMTGRCGADAYTHEVAAHLRAAAGDGLFVAEHAHDHTGDLDRDGWQGTMNYAGFLRPLWTWLRGDDLDLPLFLGVPGGVPRRDGVAALATVRAFAARVSWRALTHSWTLLGSHDTARVRTVVGDPYRQEVAAGLLMTMPGTPMVFAGDEIGLRGVDGEDSRTPMPWQRTGEWDHATFARYRELVALRRDTPALRHGGLRWVHADADALAFVRETEGESVLVLARRATGEPVRLTGVPGGANVYGGAADLRPDAAGAVTLPADGPSFQVWRS